MNGGAGIALNGSRYPPACRSSKRHHRRSDDPPLPTRKSAAAVKGSAYIVATPEDRLYQTNDRHA
ncbi:MAG: hypothetical protein ACLR9W_08020 [Enterobacter hormaechei]